MNNNEQYLLGGMLRHWDHKNAKFVKALSILKPQFFSTNEGVYIFNAISSVVADGLTPEPLSVESKLSGVQHEHYSSWSPVLMELFKNCTSAANIVSTANHIKSDYDVKAANNLFQQAMVTLNDLNIGNPRERIRSALSMLSDIEIEDGETKSSFEMKDVLSAVIDDMERMIQKGGGLYGLSTGFEHLDNQIDGLQNGETYVLAGSPGSGKTTLALNMMVNAMMDDKKVLFYSLEMPHNQIGIKLMSYKSNVLQSEIRNGDLARRRENQVQFDAAFSQMMSRQMVIDEGYNLTAENLDITTRKHEMKMGGVDLIVVDYLTLMNAQGESETVKASNAAKACKRIAKKYNCPVIILAQFVKNVIGKPKKSDLKQTGQLEQDAAAIFLLYKDPEDESITPCIEVNIDKNRHGQTGVLNMTADFGKNRFTEGGTPVEKKPEVKSQPVSFREFGNA